MEMRKPVAVDKAVQRVMKHALNGSVEFLPIHRCFNETLARDIVATHDVPHFDRSPYDGFAIRSRDTIGASRDFPVEFEVIEEIGAGSVATRKVEAKQAVRIMTGAQMPDGADAVIMLELVREIERDGKVFIQIRRRVKEDENVSFKGEDAKQGELLVNKGTKLNPGIKALLATFGYTEVPVAKKPVIGLFATGTELLEVDEALQPGKIRNSNSYMLADQIKRAGGEPRFLGILPDHLEGSYSAISEALKEVDLLITTGGVSVGDYDYMPDIYARLGAEVLFNKVAMRPGSVTTVAAMNGKILFGLSGNPSASYVGFELFVRPIIRKMLLSPRPHLKKVRGVLGENFTKANPFTRFVRSRAYLEGGQLMAVPSGKDKSNIVMSLASANSFAILPGGSRGYQQGDEVDILLLEDDEGSAWPW
ncbi:molybdopterin molybdenumtransferase [Pradoshia eiseniae]|uniref:Molybdopterin molybdenumtransferase n=1 Tax=Pradoshia eiseniae TaxID=2064768 RepID=A0A2S7N092_9BACI|nr:gephyrin-like molybdotransferase Glp [Pradoshia eiseniae]PQD95436.1 molybdopterin molybdenumtransferase [Pradoshia eiseniae]